MIDQEPIRRAVKDQKTRDALFPIGGVIIAACVLTLAIFSFIPDRLFGERPGVEADLVALIERTPTVTADDIAIDVVVSDRVATLTGTVSTEAKRRAILMQAGFADGIDRVVDELEIADPS